MFCDSCGKKIEPSATFCDHCGASVTHTQTPEEILAASPSPATHTPTDIKKYYSAGLIGVIVIGIFLISSFKKEKPDNEFESLLRDIQSSQASTTESLTSLAEENRKLKEEGDKLRSSLQTLSTQKAAPSAGSENLSQETLAKIMPRVVRVICTSAEGTSYGSGTIYSPGASSGEWLVYTNLHVIGNATRCIAGLPQGPDFIPSKGYNTSLNYYDEYYPDVDFAILGVSGASESFGEFPLRTCSASDVKIGHRVTVLGYPGFGGDSLTVTDGIVSGIEYTAYGAVYKTSAKIDNGNSGGLAVDNNSKCTIGIPTWAMAGTLEGLGYIQSWDMIGR